MKTYSIAILLLLTNLLAVDLEKIGLGGALPSRSCKTANPIATNPQITNVTPSENASTGRNNLLVTYSPGATNSSAVVLPHYTAVFASTSPYVSLDGGCNAASQGKGGESICVISDNSQTSGATRNVNLKDLKADTRYYLWTMSYDCVFDQKKFASPWQGYKVSNELASINTSEKTGYDYNQELLSINSHTEHLVSVKFVVKTGTKAVRVEIHDGTQTITDDAIENPASMLHLWSPSTLVELPTLSGLSNFSIPISGTDIDGGPAVEMVAGYKTSVNGGTQFTLYYYNSSLSKFSFKVKTAAKDIYFIDEKKRNDVKIREGGVEGAEDPEVNEILNSLYNYGLFSSSEADLYNPTSNKNSTPNANTEAAYTLYMNMLLNVEGLGRDAYSFLHSYLFTNWNTGKSFNSYSTFELRVKSMFKSLMEERGNYTTPDYYFATTHPAGESVPYAGALLVKPVLESRGNTQDGATIVGDGSKFLLRMGCLKDTDCLSKFSTLNTQGKFDKIGSGSLKSFDLSKTEDLTLFTKIMTDGLWLHGDSYSDFLLEFRPKVQLFGTISTVRTVVADAELSTYTEANRLKLIGSGVTLYNTQNDFGINKVEKDGVGAELNHFYPLEKELKFFFQGKRKNAEIELSVENLCLTGAGEVCDESNFDCENSNFADPATKSSSFSVDNTNQTFTFTPYVKTSENQTCVLVAKEKIGSVVQRIAYFDTKFGELVNKETKTVVYNENETAREWSQLLIENRMSNFQKKGEAKSRIEIELENNTMELSIKKEDEYITLLNPLRKDFKDKEGISKLTLYFNSSDEAYCKSDETYCADLISRLGENIKFSDILNSLHGRATQEGVGGINFHYFSKSTGVWRWFKERVLLMDGEPNISVKIGLVALKWNLVTDVNNDEKFLVKREEATTKSDDELEDVGVGRVLNFVAEEYAEVKFLTAPGELKEGKVKLEIIQNSTSEQTGQIQVFDSDKSIIAGLDPNGQASLVKEWVLGTGVNSLKDIPNKFFVKSTVKSSEAMDIKVKMTYFTKAGTEFVSDVIGFTAIECEDIERTGFLFGDADSQIQVSFGFTARVVMDGDVAKQPTSKGLCEYESSDVSVTFPFVHDKIPKNFNYEILPPQKGDDAKLTFGYNVFTNEFANVNYYYTPAEGQGVSKKIGPVTGTVNSFTFSINNNGSPSGSLDLDLSVVDTVSIGNSLSIIPGLSGKLIFNLNGDKELNGDLILQDVKGAQFEFNPSGKGTPGAFFKQVGVSDNNGGIKGYLKVNPQEITLKEPTKMNIESLNIAIEGNLFSTSGWGILTEIDDDGTTIETKGVASIEGLAGLTGKLKAELTYTTYGDSKTGFLIKVSTDEQTTISAFGFSLTDFDVTANIDMNLNLIKPTGPGKFALSGNISIEHGELKKANGTKIENISFAMDKDWKLRTFGIASVDVKYKNFEFQLTGLQYSFESNTHKLIVASARLDAAGFKTPGIEGEASTSGYLAIQSFEMSSGGLISIGNVSGGVKTENFSANITASFKEEGSSWNFSGSFKGELDTKIKAVIEGSVTIGYFVTTNPIGGFPYGHFVLKLQSEAGVPVGATPIVITRIGGELGINYNPKELIIYEDDGTTVKNSYPMGPNAGQHFFGGTIGIGDVLKRIELTGEVGYNMCTESAVNCVDYISLESHLSLPRSIDYSGSIFHGQLNGRYIFGSGKVEGVVSGSINFPAGDNPIVNIETDKMKYIINSNENNWSLGHDTDDEGNKIDGYLWKIPGGKFELKIVSGTIKSGGSYGEVTKEEYNAIPAKNQTGNDIPGDYDKPFNFSAALSDLKIVGDASYDINKVFKGTDSITYKNKENCSWNTYGIISNGKFNVEFLLNTSLGLDLSNSEGIQFEFSAAAKAGFTSNLKIIYPVLWGVCEVTSDIAINADFKIDYANSTVAKLGPVEFNLNYFLVHGKVNLDNSIDGLSEDDESGENKCNADDAPDTDTDDDCKKGGFEIDVVFPYLLPPPYSITIGASN